MEIQLKNKKFYINGSETLILAGEIHYFRLDVADWEDRIIRLKEAGFNAVATYIPWSIHEQEEGVIDLVGFTKKQYNLKLFVELVAKHDLYFIPRPGPFVMAETTGDGVPLWLSQNYDDVNLKCWDGNDGTTVTRDYLAPSFKKYANIWLTEVFKILLAYKDTNIISIQLDNEIGMLSWVSNCPDLNENNIKLMMEFLQENNRHTSYSFDITNYEECLVNFRSPKEDDVVAYHHDLGYFNRQKFAKYTKWLEEVITNNGFGKTPLLINVHGTGGGKLYGYPIGLSQLIETYSEHSNISAGSDLYFDNVDLSDFHEWYLASCLTESTLDCGQPLMSLELNATSGDYGNSITNRKLNSSLDIQIHMLLAQNNKVLNFYLFTGGFNDTFNHKVCDGRNRVGNTGQLHGYGAPIGPNGDEAYFYDVIKRVGRLNQAVGSKLAKMTQTKDSIGFGFIPDYYMTEFKYPGSKVINEVFSNFERNRANKIYETVFKYSLIRGYQPDCINLQKHQITKDDLEIMMVPVAKYMPRYVQENLVNYAKSGGKLILVGEVALYDNDGTKCSVLADYLKLSIDDSYQEKQFKTVVPSGYLSGIESHFIYDGQAIKSDCEHISIFDLYDSNSSCGLEITTDETTIIFISCAYRMDEKSFDLIFERLNVTKTLDVVSNDIGHYAMLNSYHDEHLLSLINLDENSKQLDVSINGSNPFGGFNPTLRGRITKFLPINLQYDDYTIKYATEQIYSRTSGKLTFELMEKEFRLELITPYQIRIESEFVDIMPTTDGYIIKKTNRLIDEQKLTIELIK